MIHTKTKMIPVAKIIVILPLKKPTYCQYAMQNMLR